MNAPDSHQALSSSSDIAGDVAGLMELLGSRAKAASAEIARAPAAAKNKALLNLAKSLRKNTVVLQPARPGARHNRGPGRPPAGPAQAHAQDH
jgi:glutamate-5-semialdehyde dehydrogenase